METIIMDKDINILYIEAESFPEGIVDAHKKLHALIPFIKDRKYFGISRPEKGIITYKAAAEEKKEDEVEKLNFATLVLKKGKYISITIKDYKKDLKSIGKAFESLLSFPGIDPQGYCVEWYLTDEDMKCMIRLTD